MQNPLDQVLEIIKSAPHSAAALTLYALVNTLAYEKAGCLFKLTKLKDLDEAERQLAYALMEYLATGGTVSAEFARARAAMDELVRAA